MKQAIQLSFSAALMIAICAISTSLQAAERLSGTNVDVRTQLFFESPEASVRKLIPDGWEIDSPSKGPFKGFNLIVVLIDSVSARDENEKPINPFHGAVLAIPAKKSGADDRGVIVVDGISEEVNVPGAYGVYTAGRVHIERRSEVGTNAKSTVEERWEIQSNDGNLLTAQIDYQRDATTRSEISSRVYSAAKPGFFRLYRGSQVTQLLRSTITGVDHITKISVSGSGPRLGPVFDGTEKLIGVLSIPSYVRSIYLPQ